MSGRDAPDWMSSIQRPAFAAPGSPFTVAASGTKTLDVALDTTIHTVTVLLAKVTGTVTLSVTGDVTGYEYVPATNTTTDAIFRAAVAAQFDDSVTVTVTADVSSGCDAYVGMASDPESLTIANTVTTTGSVQVTNKVEVTGTVEATFPSAQQVEFATPQDVTATFSSPQEVTFPSAQEVTATFTSPQEVTFPSAQQVTIDTTGGPVEVAATINTGQEINVTPTSGSTFSVAPSAAGGMPVASGPAGGLPVTTGTGGLEMTVNNTVDIQTAAGTTLDVQFPSAQAVTVDTSGGPVAVAATINAGQSIEVTQATGDSLAVAPASSTGLPIAPAGTNGLPVTTGSGGLDVTVNNTVEVSQGTGSTFDVQFPSAQEVLFATSQPVKIDTSGGAVQTTIDTSGGPVEISATGTTDVSIQEAYVADNSLVLLGTFTAALNLEAGAQSAELGMANLNAAGFYDGIIVDVYSPGRNDYTLQPVSNLAFYEAQVTAPDTPTITKYGGGAGGSGPTHTLFIGVFQDPFIFDGGYFYLTNAGSAAVNETVTINMYGIKASVGTSLAPVQTKPALKVNSQSFGHFSWSNQSVGPNGGATAWQTSGVLSAENLSKVIFVCYVDTISGSVSQGQINVELEVFGSPDSSISEQWEIISQVNGSQFWSVGYEALDSGNIPGMLAGYPYLGIRGRLVNNSTSTLSGGLYVYVTGYWQD